MSCCGVDLIIKLCFHWGDLKRVENDQEHIDDGPFFFFWLPFTVWVKHRDQFVFMIHCFLECVSKSCHVSQAPLTDTSHGSARLSCRAAPALCQGIVLAPSWHGLWPLTLSLAWLVSTSLPKLPPWMGKNSKIMRQGFHFLHCTKLPLLE